MKLMKKHLIILSFLFLAACQTQVEPPQSAEFTAEKEELKKLVQGEKDKSDFNNAAQLETQLMSLDANKPETIISTSKVLKKQGKRAEAIQLLAIGEKLNPADEKLQLEEAIDLIEADRQAEALDKLKNIKTLRNKDYYNAKGVANDMLGDHVEAQIAFNEGLKMSPDDGLMLNNLALSYILSHKYDKAIKILKDLVKRSDAKPKYRQNLALAYGITAKPEQAYQLLIKDLPKAQADENLKFYKEIRKSQ